MIYKGLSDKLPYTLKFFLNKRRKSGTKFPLACRIMVNRTKSEIFLSKDVEVTEWDEKTGRYCGTTQHHHYLNGKLSEIEGKFQDIYFDLERMRIPIVATMMTNSFSGKRINAFDYTLLTFLDDFVKEIKTKQQEYVPATIQHYIALKGHLQNFLKSLGLKDMRLDAINRNIVDRFDTFLMTWVHPVLNRAMTRNTANRYLTKLKVIIHAAIRKEILVKSPFWGFKISRVRTQRIFLTQEELKLITDHDLCNNASLQRVRDVFIFSVYTGLRFSDVYALKSKAISVGEDGRLWITLNQAKTKDPLHIPMLKPAEDIYKKYEELRKVTGLVLPNLSSQKINTSLKEIAKLTGVTKNFTFHSGRHTFATTITLEQGVGIKTVSQWLGHTSIKSTEVYAQVTKKILSDTAQKLNDGIAGK